jgi:regulatory protein
MDGSRDGGRPTREITPAVIKEWALGYLGRYASSTENLRRVLLRRIRRRSPDAVAELGGAVEALIQRYRASGLIDDAAYALARAQSLHRRGESQFKIRARLLSKGVDAAVAGEAVAALGAEEAGDPDLAAACAFARRRRFGPYRRGEGDRARELAAFARAGFARRIAQAVLACPDTAAVEALARNGID